MSCTQVCIDKDRGYECSCNPGYYLYDKVSCLACDDEHYGVNCEQECNCASNVKTCDKVEGCVECIDGWEGFDCATDIDECTATLNICGAHSDCINSEGSFVCICHAGYDASSQSSVCADVNECINSPCSQSCQNTAGSFICACETGYMINPATNITCLDVNECDSGDDDCDDIHGICINNIGGFSCLCDVGYEVDEDGKTCNDFDECLSNSTHRCYETVCINEAGGYDCTCDDGYRLSPMGIVCIDIDECDSSNQCQHQDKCVNVYGTYRCECPDGFLINADLRTCGDTNECESDHLNDCGVGTCINYVGTYSCICPDGYQTFSDSKSCTDVDECNGINSCDQICVNSAGSYTCACNEGYTLHDNDRTCSNIDECAANLDNCAHNCVDTLGYFTCTCFTGFTLDADLGNCTPQITDCTQVLDDCEVGCRGTNVNEFECFCQRGYVLNRDGRHCDDRNECLSVNLCTGTCNNIPGGYTCACENGFQLNDDRFSCRPCDSEHWGLDCTNDCNCNSTRVASCSSTEGCIICRPGWEGGIQCPDNINECLIENICGNDAICEDTEGSYKCICNSGYFSISQLGGCEDVDECLTGRSGCADKCDNTIGSYSCSCMQSGYLLAADNHACIDIDECLINSDNSCDQNCINVPGSYSCSCIAGFVLNTDASTCDDLDECVVLSPCEDHCANTIGSFLCSCLDHGKVLAEDHLSCVSVDVCTLCNADSSLSCNSDTSPSVCICQEDYYGVACNHLIKTRELHFPYANISLEMDIALPWNYIYETENSESQLRIFSSVQAKIYSWLNSNYISLVSMSELKPSSANKTTVVFHILYDTPLTRGEISNVGIRLWQNIADDRYAVTLQGSTSTDVHVDSLYYSAVKQYLISHPARVEVNSLNICYYYEALDICQHNALCTGIDSIPKCNCVSGYEGEFCHHPIPSNIAPTVDTLQFKLCFDLLPWSNTLADQTDPYTENYKLEMRESLTAALNIPDNTTITINSFYPSNCDAQRKRRQIDSPSRVGVEVVIGLDRPLIPDDYATLTDELNQVFRQGIVFDSETVLPFHRIVTINGMDNYLEGVTSRDACYYSELMGYCLNGATCILVSLKAYCRYS